MEPAPLRGISREGRLKLQERCQRAVDDCQQSLDGCSTTTARLAGQWSQERKDLAALTRELHTVKDYNADEEAFLRMVRFCSEKRGWLEHVCIPMLQLFPHAICPVSHWCRFFVCCVSCIG